MLGESQRRQAQLETLVRDEASRADTLAAELKAATERGTELETRGAELHNCLVEMASGLKAHRTHMSALRTLHQQQAQQVVECADRISTLEKENRALRAVSPSKRPPPSPSPITGAVHPVRAFDAFDTFDATSVPPPPIGALAGAAALANAGAEELASSSSMGLSSALLYAGTPRGTSPRGTSPRGTSPHPASLRPPSRERARMQPAGNGQRAVVLAHHTPMPPPAAAASVSKGSGSKSRKARTPLAVRPAAATNHHVAMTTPAAMACKAVLQQVSQAANKESPGEASPLRLQYTSSDRVVAKPVMATPVMATVVAPPPPPPAAEPLAEPAEVGAGQDEKIQKLIHTCSYWASVLHAAQGLEAGA